jgi:hypothetical protein
MSKVKKQPETEGIQPTNEDDLYTEIDSTVYQEESSTPPVDFIGKYKRNEHGLIDSVLYQFNEDGSVDWRKMVKDEFLYPNKGFFECRKQPVPTSIEGLKDNQLLIMLAGIKELAKLRGFTGVSYEVNHVSESYVVAKCSINWICNYETENAYGVGVTYEDVANATLANTDDFCAKFLETIACNRAFVRCVRNFLNVHIVGADEIDKSKSPSNSSSESIESTGYDNNTVPVTPTGILEKTLREKHGVVDFEGAKVIFRKLWAANEYRGEGVKVWKDFSDIPAKEARILLPLVNKK